MTGWHPEPIGAAVRAELARFGPAAGMADLVAVWPAAVGRAVAENAWPARAGRDGTVTVATSSSVWAFELTNLEEEIRSRLHAHLGAAAPPRLRFAVGRLPERGRSGDGSLPPAPPAIPPEARQAAAELSAAVADPELRALVARAAAASLARAVGASAPQSSGETTQPG
ncbi:MAG: DUF721 domain-containing protein [Thermoleophilia bacterium]|nr:DUF721 domain-containing protein [Thermoleophilia bacterium]